MKKKHRYIVHLPVADISIPMQTRDADRSAGSVLDALLNKRAKFISTQLSQHPHRGVKKLLASRPPAKLLRAAVDASGGQKVSNINPLFISMAKTLKFHGQKRDLKDDLRDSPIRRNSRKRANKGQGVMSPASLSGETVCNPRPKKRRCFFSNSDIPPPTSRASQGVESSRSLAALKQRLRDGKGQERRDEFPELVSHPKRHKAEPTLSVASSSVGRMGSIEKRKTASVLAKGDIAPKDTYRWVRHCTSLKTKTMHRGITKAASLFRYYGWPTSAAERSRFAEILPVYWKRLAIAPWKRKPSRAACLRRALCILNRSFWLLVQRIIAIRRSFVKLLSHSFLITNTTPNSKATPDLSSSVLGPRLALARLFPLFGLVVRVLWIQWEDSRMDDAHKAHEGLSRVIAESEFGRLTITACEKGIVLHESKNRVGVVLLPRKIQLERAIVWGGNNTHPAACPSTKGSSSEQEAAEAVLTIARCITPKVIQVRKVFSGFSGSETDLIQKLLLFVNRTVQEQDSPRKGKLVVAMVVGEVSTALPEITDSNLLDCLRNRFL